jgi:hypothetical protein
MIIDKLCLPVYNLTLAVKEKKSAYKPRRNQGLQALCRD